MGNSNINKVREGDYILLITKSKLSFAGTVERLEESNGKQIIIFQPSKNSPLWIMIEESFIETLKVLIPSAQRKK